MKISWAVAIFVVTTKAFFKKIFSVNEKRSDLCLSSFLSLAVALRSLWPGLFIISSGRIQICVCVWIDDLLFPKRNKNYHCCCCYGLIMDKRKIEEDGTET